MAYGWSHSQENLRNDNTILGWGEEICESSSKTVLGTLKEDH